MNKFSLRKVFIYLTEKCNLNCDYCFFKDKTRKRTLSQETLRTFLDWLSSVYPRGPAFFEFSGGEPLLEWNRLKNGILEVQRRFPAAEIGVQTNGLLLDRKKQAFLKKQGIQIEIGLDGAFAVTHAHRRGITAPAFKTLLANIAESLNNGLDVSCTQTVHPHETRSMKANSDFLKKTGLKNIDITPAALTCWTSAQVRSFKAQYRKILARPLDKRLFFLEDDVVFLETWPLDFSLHPPGYVLCGDVFLCLTDREKNQKAVLVLKDRKKRFQEKSFRSFWKPCQKAFAGKKYRTYKDYVIFCFEILGKWFKSKRSGCRVMTELLTFQKRIHQKRIAENRTHVRTH